MKYLLIICIILVASSAKAQWHSIDDSLQQPKMIGGYYASTKFATFYDTLSCLYRTVSGIYRGYKRIHAAGGFYEDDSSTFRVIYNRHFKRFNGVIAYKFIQ